MNNPGPGPLEAARRSDPGDRSGCLTAIYVLFGVGVLVLVIGGATAYFFLQSEEGQKIVTTAKRGLELVAAASNAEGTEELRDAGCEVAMIDSADSVIDVIAPLLSDENAKYEMQSSLEAQVGRDLEGLVLVFCTVPQFLQDAPECTDLARTYGGAVEFPPDDFAVIVAQQGQDSPLCSGIYTPGGELRHAFETN